MRVLAALVLALAACRAGEPIEDHRFHATYEDRIVFTPRPGMPDGLRLWIQNLGPGSVELLVVPRAAPASTWHLSFGDTESFVISRLVRLEARLGSESHAAIEWAASSTLRAHLDVVVDPETPPAE